MANQPDIFWRDGEFGECVGGFYIKSDLNKFITKCKEANLNPVGIKIEDGMVEVIVQRTPEYVAQYEKDKK